MPSMEKSLLHLLKGHIWVVDESKMVDQLGAFKLPVEVVQYGADRLYRVFDSKGYKPSFRLTEQGNRVPQI